MSVSIRDTLTTCGPTFSKALNLVETTSFCLSCFFVFSFCHLESHTHIGQSHRGVGNKGTSASFLPFRFKVTFAHFITFQRTCALTLWSINERETLHLVGWPCHLFRQNLVLVAAFRSKHYLKIKGTTF